MTPVALGLDVGGTRARWAVSDGIEILARGEGEGFSGHIFDDEARTSVRTILESLVADASRAGPVRAIVAAVTGLDDVAPASVFVREVLAAASGAHLDRIRAVNDMVGAHASAFAPGEGILVYAGTGSIGAYVSPQGVLTTVGGRGAAMDDAGSAYAIAMAALRHVHRLEDVAPGSGWETPVGRALAARLGGTDWTTVRAAVYGGDRGSVGLLARAVGDAAAERDATALALLEEGGRELARLAMALIGRFGALPVALTGGAAQLHPIVFKTFRATLSGQADPVLIAIDPAAAAARLAAGSLSPP